MLTCALQARASPALVEQAADGTKPALRLAGYMVMKGAVSTITPACLVKTASHKTNCVAVQKIKTFPWGVNTSFISLATPSYWKAQVNFQICTV